MGVNKVEEINKNGKKMENMKEKTHGKLFLKVEYLTNRSFRRENRENGKKKK